MATPEDAGKPLIESINSQLPSHVLRVVSDGSPDANNAFIFPNLERERWESMTKDELLAIRGIVSAYRGGLALHIHELQLLFDAALLAQIEVNGRIRDRG